MFIPNPTARYGESIASDFLTKKGYRIIEKNFRHGYGELDIIATNNGILVFVEVKTRTTQLFGGAREAIRTTKLKNIIRTALFYKMLHPELPQALRIDAVLIDIDTKNSKHIEHIENISGF